MIKFKKNNSFIIQDNSAFTLIEAMVAIVLIGIIGFILADLLSRSFRGSDKTQLVSKVVQNGQIVLNNMEQTIRNAKSIICIGNLPTNSQSNTSLVILNNEQQYLRYSFVAPTPVLNPTSNGYILQETLNVTTLPQNLLDFCQNQTTSAFSVSANLKLTDSTATGVSVSTSNLPPGSFPFTRIVQPGFNDAVTIYFQIGPSVLAKGGFQNLLGGSGTLDFKTTVQLR